MCMRPVQLVYSRNGVNITATPVEHYTTAGPVAYRLDWNGLSVTYSGAQPIQEHLLPGIFQHATSLQTCNLAAAHGHAACQHVFSLASLSGHLHDSQPC
jgi:hypothetical protein